MKKTLIFSLIMVIGLVGTVSAQDLLVPADYLTIQAAIDIAAEGDTVIVADGTYTGDGNRDISFRGKAITVRSENGPESTIIDCQGSESDPHCGFYFQSGEDADSVLDGFTITNGYGGSWGNNGGGGIYCRDSSPKITNCIITGNIAGPSHYLYYGGGIFCHEESSPIIMNCVITGNSAPDGGGIAYYRRSGNATITNCIISGNSAMFGGGIYCRGDYNLKINNSEITGNFASQRGGGIRSYENLTVTNSTIAGNTILEGGEYGGGIAHAFGEAAITNSILWGNSAPQGPQFYADGRAGSRELTLTVSYSDIQGAQSGIYLTEYATLIWDDGNIDEDPYFVDPCNNDFHLSAESLCINAGDPNYVPEPNETDLDGLARVNEGRIDMGAYEFTLSDPLDLLDMLAQDVIDLELHPGIENSLLVKLDTAIDKLQDDNENNDAAAVNALQAFINAVEAQSGKKIPEQDADALIAAAQQILELLM